MQRPITAFLLASIIACAAFNHPASVSAANASLRVNNTVDLADAKQGDGICETAPGNRLCTLRAAVQEANALPGPDVIFVPAGTFALNKSDDCSSNSSLGDIDITSQLEITGAGPLSTMIDGNGLDRIFDIASSADVRLKALAIRNGRACYGGGVRNSGKLAMDFTVVSDSSASMGGGIYNNGTLTLYRTIVRNNRADLFSGGGIANEGQLYISTSEIDHNYASHSGGGISSDDTLFRLTTPPQMTAIGVFIHDNTTPQFGGGLSLGGAGRITNSALVTNSAYAGGGISVVGDLKVQNVTMSGNQSIVTGSALLSSGTTTLLHATIAANQILNPTGWDGAAAIAGSGIAFGHSVVAGSVGSKNCTSATVSSLGYNIDDGNSCGFTGLGDQRNADPKLAPLAQGDGFSTIYALLPGSPAIDAGNPTSCAENDGVPIELDQRGVSRPRDGDGDGVARCDIGAFEYQPRVVATTVSADADGRVQRRTPDKNFGSAIALTVDGSDDLRTTYIGIVVDDVQGRVRKATLRLYVGDNGTRDGPKLYSADTYWQESTITWNTRPALAGAPIADLAAIGTNTWVEYDVTALVRGLGDYTIALVGDSTNSVTFASRESAHPPELILTMGD